MGETVNKPTAKTVKKPVVYTRKQIAWATTKVVALVSVGIIIGVLATQYVQSRVDTAVVNQVTALKANQ